MIGVWKAAAPHVDLVAPDVYTRDARTYVAYLDHCARADNALLVPETGNAVDHARFLWAALGRGAIGFAPFGMDGTGYSNFPPGARTLDAATIAAVAAPYRLLAPSASRSGWRATPSARRAPASRWGAPWWRSSGRTSSSSPGATCGCASRRPRLAPAAPAAGEQAQLPSAEEGTFVGGRWVMRRRWNGDQVDYGFDLGAEPVLLRVRMGTFR